MVDASVLNAYMVAATCVVGLDTPESCGRGWMGATGVVHLPPLLATPLRRCPFSE